MERSAERLEAVLFDAAGTLIELREPVGATYARFAARLGLHIAAAPLQEEFARELRRRRAPVFPGAARAESRARERAWWADLVRQVLGAAAPGAPLENFDAEFALLFAHYGGAAAWQCAPGARELLAALRARGLRSAVVSNFDQRLHAILRELALRPLLDAVVLPADAGVAKPDAAIFHCALRALGVAAGAALFVGDDPDEDVAAAEGVGMAALHVGAGGLAAVRAALEQRLRAA